MNADSAIDSSPPSSAAPSSVPPARRRRRLLPRFRLPAAFAAAVLFCFFCAWIRSNYVRMLEEEAAVEALLQVDAGIEFQWDPDRSQDYAASQLDLRDRSFLKRLGRSLNWMPPPQIAKVTFKSEDPNDAKLLIALAGLRMFPELWHVDLQGPGFDDRAIAELAKVDSLRSLHLFRTRVTGDGLASLADHASLHAISVVGDPTGDLLRGVLSLKDLTLVSLSGSPLTKDDVTTLASFPHLLQLFLTRIPFSDKPDLLLPLEQAGSLLELSIRADGVDEGAVVELPSLPQLETLTVEGVAVANLPPYPKLEELDAAGFTDEMLAKWSIPRGLRSATLHPPVTRDGARTFAAKAVSSWCSVTYYPADGKAVTYDAR